MYLKIWNDMFFIKKEGARNKANKFYLNVFNVISIIDSLGFLTKGESNSRKYLLL